MPPSLTKCWATWARSCVDLVWIVLSCQATQAERPDSLTQSKPNLRMVLLHSAQHFWVTEAWITLTFNCPIQISKFFHKTSPVRCPLPAHLIKSMDIEKKFSVDKNVIWAFEGNDYNNVLKKIDQWLGAARCQPAVSSEMCMWVGIYRQERGEIFNKKAGR